MTVNNDSTGAEGFAAEYGYFDTKLKMPEPVLDIIGLVNQWNKDAGRTEGFFNPRQTAFYTGMQCEEMGEKLRACGLLGIAGDLERVGKELKEGVWDSLIRDQALDAKNRIEMLDGDCDIMVVTIGSAQGQGADFARAMGKVIAANEAKRFPDGKLHKNEHGKILKPEGWKAPNLVDCCGNLK